MNKTSKPLRIVITGASSGIGAATAVAFAERGAKLVIAARGRSGLNAVGSRCRSVGVEVHERTVDVTDAAAVARFAEDARALLGGIDLWFSNVGVGVVGKFQDVPAADHAQVIATNLVGHMNDAHAVMPIFLAQGHGIFVNMISVGGFFATPYAAAYAASKYGLRGFSEALRGELSQHARIHICDVYPTFVDTPGIDHAANYTGAKLSLPPGSLAPETVANAVVRLASRPRNTLVVGAPAMMLKLNQFLAPNLGPAMMSRFLDAWSRKAEPSDDYTGALYNAPPMSGSIEGGYRHPERRRRLAVAAGGTAGIAVLGAYLLRHRK